MYSNSSTAKAVGGVPDPVQAYVTRWAADPYSRGAYSYYATGNSRNIIGVLLQQLYTGSARLNLRVIPPYTITDWQAVSMEAFKGSKFAATAA